MFTRAYPLTFVSVLVLAATLASCGGGSKSGGNSSSSCTPRTMSVPHSPNDPCPQTPDKAPMCPFAQGYVAVSTCQDNGTWNLTCACVMGGSLGGAGASGGLGSVCATAPQCNANTAIPTCKDLGAGSGLVTCDLTTCKFNTSMCHAGGGVGGAGQ